MTGFSSMGRQKCVNPFPLGESQCIATAPHAPIRPPIIGGWSAAPKASTEPPYRMRSGSMPVMQDEQGGKPIKDLGDANLIGEDEIGPNG